MVVLVVGGVDNRADRPHRPSVPAREEESRFAVFEGRVLPVQDDAHVAAELRDPLTVPTVELVGKIDELPSRGTPGRLDHLEVHAPAHRASSPAVVVPEGCVLVKQWRFAILAAGEGDSVVKSLFAETLYTGDEVVRNIHLLFEGSVVKGISMEPRGEIIGKFPVVTPAFIDAHCHIGMERSGEPGSEGEANERMESLLFLADALDSVQMDDSAFRDSVELGVLYSCVLPGSGNIIGGKSAIIRNYARTTTEALIARSGVKAAFGYNPMSTRDWKGARPYTRMGALSLLRAKLAQVKAKLGRPRKGAKPGPDSILSAEEQVIRDIL